jgi:L-arabinose isomerase
MRAFLESGGFKAFTTTFEDLHGLAQLPGLAVQRLMNDGYGFGAEGDWKTSALVRAMKVMGAGLPGGTSFMEDYTYHLSTNGSGMKVLGAHMLEVCAFHRRQQSLAGNSPAFDRRQSDPVRLVFNVNSGPGAQCLDGRYGQPLPHDRQRGGSRPAGCTPAQAAGRARGLDPKPNLKVAAAAWIYAGGAHHTGFSQGKGIGG